MAAVKMIIWPSLFSVSRSAAKVTECQELLWLSLVASAAADLFSKLSFFYEKQCVVDISLLKGLLS